MNKIVFIKATLTKAAFRFAATQTLLSWLKTATKFARITCICNDGIFDKMLYLVLTWGVSIWTTSANSILWSSNVFCSKMVEVLLSTWIFYRFNFSSKTHLLVPKLSSVVGSVRNFAVTSSLKKAWNITISMLPLLSKRFRVQGH